MPAEESAKLCNIYLRPWTLNKNDADIFVPHLLQLAQVPVLGKRLKKKMSAAEYMAKSKLYTSSESHVQVPLQAAVGASETCCSWRNAWQWYVDGHVVSEHACRVITNLLTNTLGKSAPDGESSEDDEDEAGTRDFDPIKPFCPSFDILHKILRDQHSPETDAVSTSRAKQEQARTIKRTRAMWESSHVGDAERAASVDTSGTNPQ